MAVLVQEMVPGQASGILFTQDPSHTDQGLIEGVHGMNPPLVDGKISPDRWVFEVDTGQVIDHISPSSRTQWQPPDSTLTVERLLPLPEELKSRPPLDPGKIATLWATGQKVVSLFGLSQDIEWTFRDDALVLLQARPITTSMEPAEGDSRAWYLSLHRSLENLLALRRRIEDELIPQMQAEAHSLAVIRLDTLEDGELALEIRRRWEINRYWASVYWDDFIPFAHGMRLFGQVYNQVMTPEDPYEFMRLLKNQDLISIRRNRELSELAAGVRSQPRRATALADNNLDAFVMPLAAGIIERRGGMLIHGAIIAREYGLPCVTGVVDATRRIRTGQTVTVDGYLGIVTIADKSEENDSNATTRQKDIEVTQ